MKKIKNDIRIKTETEKKSRNLSRQKNHATSWDKKIHTTTQDKKMQPLGTKNKTTS